MKFTSQIKLFIGCLAAAILVAIGCMISSVLAFSISFGLEFVDSTYSISGLGLFALSTLCISIGLYILVHVIFNFQK